MAYDLNDTQTLTIEYDVKAWQVQELKIGEHTGPRPKLPKSMLRALPDTSRLLDEKEKQYASRQDTVRRAICYLKKYISQHQYRFYNLHTRKDWVFLLKNFVL